MTVYFESYFGHGPHHRHKCHKHRHNHRHWHNNWRYDNNNSIIDDVLRRDSWHDYKIRRDFWGKHTPLKWDAPFWNYHDQLTYNDNFHRFFTHHNMPSFWQDNNWNSYRTYSLLDDYRHSPFVVYAFD